MVHMKKMMRKLMLFMQLWIREWMNGVKREGIIIALSREALFADFSGSRSQNL